jgi:hypothetical protein
MQILADSIISVFTLAPRMVREQVQVTWINLALVTAAGV